MSWWTELNEWYASNLPSSFWEKIPVTTAARYSTYAQILPQTVIDTASKNIAENGQIKVNVAETLPFGVSFGFGAATILLGGVLLYKLLK